MTHICITHGILSPKVFSDSTLTNSPNAPSSRHSYPTSVKEKFSDHPQHVAYANHAPDNDLVSISPLERRIGEQQPQRGYSYDIPQTEFANQRKIPSNHRSIPVRHLSGHRTHEGSSAWLKPIVTTSKPRVQEPAKSHPQLSRRPSYQVVEDVDEYLTDDSDHGGSAYRGRDQPKYQHRDSQDVTTAIKSLDHFLSGVLNDDGYNSKLHPPPNPVLALVLSRYGRYVPGARSPRVYAYMAVNNIHNNKPFGRYKQECEEEPSTVESFYLEISSVANNAGIVNKNGAEVHTSRSFLALSLPTQVHFRVASSDPESTSEGTRLRSLFGCDLRGTRTVHSFAIPPLPRGTHRAGAEDGNKLEIPHVTRPSSHSAFYPSSSSFCVFELNYGRVKAESTWGGGGCVGGEVGAGFFRGWANSAGKKGGRKASKKVHAPRVHRNCHGVYNCCALFELCTGASSGRSLPCRATPPRTLQLDWRLVCA
ncbi:hypothetical protein KM043_007111 [Ampulex compressa]|nr:hypothetical protein KM043_007111 [Ampulex compressa]